MCSIVLQIKVVAVVYFICGQIIIKLASQLTLKSRLMLAIKVGVIAQVLDHTVHTVCVFDANNCIIYEVIGHVFNKLTGLVNLK